MSKGSVTLPTLHPTAQQGQRNPIRSYLFLQYGVQIKVKERDELKSKIATGNAFWKLPVTLLLSFLCCCMLLVPPSVVDVSFNHGNLGRKKAEGEVATGTAAALNDLSRSALNSNLGKW